MKSRSNGSSAPRQSASKTAGEDIYRPIDLAPRALWRLIQIGELAGIITHADHSVIFAAFRNGPHSHSSLGRVLDVFHCDVTELYVLATLYAAAPCPVSLKKLALDAHVAPTAITPVLKHLDDIGATSHEITEENILAISLTPLGVELAMVLIYNALNVFCSKDSSQNAATASKFRKQARRLCGGLTEVIDPASN